jgi:hypothetical protein
MLERDQVLDSLFLGQAYNPINSQRIVRRIRQKSIWLPATSLFHASVTEWWAYAAENIARSRYSGLSIDRPRRQLRFAE